VLLFARILSLVSSSFIRVSDLTNISLIISIRDSPLELSLKFFNNIEISLTSPSIFNSFVYLLDFIFFERFIPKPVIFTPIILGEKTYFILFFSFIVELVYL
jgi:hypothetical protein